MNQLGELFFASGFFLTAINLIFCILYLYGEKRTGRKSSATTIHLRMMAVGVTVMIVGVGFTAFYS